MQRGALAEGANCIAAGLSNACPNGGDWASVASPDDTCSDLESCVSSPGQAEAPTPTAIVTKKHSRQESSDSEKGRSETESEQADDDSGVQLGESDWSDDLLTPRVIRTIRREADTPEWKPRGFRRRSCDESESPGSCGVGAYVDESEAYGAACAFDG